MRSSLCTPGTLTQLPAHTTTHVWQPTQWAALFSPKNLPCPPPLAQGAVGVCLTAHPRTHEESRLCLCCSPAVNVGIHGSGCE